MLLQMLLKYWKISAQSLKLRQNIMVCSAVFPFSFTSLTIGANASSKVVFGLTSYMIHDLRGFLNTMQQFPYIGIVWSPDVYFY